MTNDEATDGQSLRWLAPRIKIFIRGFYGTIPYEKLVAYSPSDAEVVKYESLRAVGCTVWNGEASPCPAGQSGRDSTDRL